MAAPCFPLDLTIDRLDAGFRLTVRTQIGIGGIEAASMEELTAKFLEAYARAVEDAEDLQAARDGLEDARVNGTIPWEQIEAESGL